MTAKITLSANQGNGLAKVSNISVSNIVSRRQNKELYLLLSLDQESPFPAGDYVITDAVKVDISGERFEIIRCESK